MGFQEIDILNTRNDYDMAQDFVNDNYPYVHFAKDVTSLTATSALALHLL